MPLISLTRRPTASRFRFHILARLLFFLALAGLVYSLAVLWFKIEIENQMMALVRAEVSETAGRFVRSEPALAADGGTRLGHLIGSHRNIVAAMLTDADGRFAAIQVEQGAHYPQLSAFILRLLPDLGRMSGAQVLELIGRDYPSLEPLRIPVTRDGALVGWLYVFIDRELAREALEMAAGRMMANLFVILAVLAIVVLITGFVIHRQRRQAVLLRAQRDRARELAYVGTLAAGLAHEIRNPINALAMQIDMLEEDFDADARLDARRRLARIRDGLGGLEHTVRDFLTYATPDKPRPALLDLPAELEAIGREFLERLPEAERPDLQWHAPAGLQAWCDPHALRQVVGNLLVNAVRAQQGEPRPRARIEAQRAGAHARVTVEDAGPGVPADTRDRLFEAFFTTKAEGTGLGLPIARRLAEMNGGALDLAPDPSPLGGARFVLTLPARPGEPNGPG